MRKTLKVKRYLFPPTPKCRGGGGASRGMQWHFKGNPTSISLSWFKRNFLDSCRKACIRDWSPRVLSTVLLVETLRITPRPGVSRESQGKN